MTDRPTGLRRSTLAALVAAALIGGAVPVWAAVLSQPTGIIEGRAPTATGNLYALLPDGATKVTNNVVVSQAATPNQFTVSADTTGLIPSDLDGDTGLTLTPNMAGATLVWKQSNGTPLTPAQLAAPLVSNFPNSTVTLEVQAPVTVTSTTGLPTSAGPQSFVTTYAVKVPVVPLPLPASVKFNVNGYQFAGNSGFPRTGYTGASYQLWMNGTGAASNSSYTYSSSEAWLTISATGVIAFSVKPTLLNRNAKITVTPVSGVGASYVFTVQPQSWYSYKGSTTSRATANAWCTAVGGARPTFGQLANGTYYTAGNLNPSYPTRAVGPHWSEWGNFAGVYVTYGSTTGVAVRDKYTSPTNGYSGSDVTIHQISNTQSETWRWESSEEMAQPRTATIVCNEPII